MVSVLHHRVRADLPKTSLGTRSGRSDLESPTELCDHRKMQLLFEFCDSLFFAGLRAALCTEKMTAKSSQMAKSRTLVCLVFLSLLPSHLCGVGAA